MNIEVGDFLSKGCETIPEHCSAFGCPLNRWLPKGELGYGTTNADAGVGIGLQKGDPKI